MREKILDGAARLIQQYGLKKFTVNELAAELGISKKTLYQHFESKDAIIAAYFDAAVNSDKENVKASIDGMVNFGDKIHAVIYSEHRYRLSVSILSDAKKFYPDEWKKVEALKQYKLDTVRDIFDQGVKEGIFKQDVHFGVLSEILTKLSDIYTDYDFLTENHLNAREAIDHSLSIIFNGILQ